MVTVIIWELFNLVIWYSYLLKIWQDWRLVTHGRRPTRPRKNPRKNPRWSPRFGWPPWASIQDSALRKGWMEHIYSGWDRNAGTVPISCSCVFFVFPLFDMIAGWCFGCHFLLSHILEMSSSLNWRTHILQWGGPTTNQYWWCSIYLFSSDQWDLYGYILW